MKKALKRVEYKIWHFLNGNKVEGAPFGITGNLTGIRGALTSITGNLSDCELTEEERKRGVSVEELIEE